MLLVEHLPDGWAISFSGLPLGRKDTQREAIEAASAHAQDRYAVTGQPIGVFVRMACGDEVLVGQHG